MDNGKIVLIISVLVLIISIIIAYILATTVVIHTQDINIVGKLCLLVFK